MSQDINDYDMEPTQPTHAPYWGRLVASSGSIEKLSWDRGYANLLEDEHEYWFARQVSSPKPPFKIKDPTLLRFLPAASPLTRPKAATNTRSDISDRVVICLPRDPTRHLNAIIHVNDRRIQRDETPWPLVDNDWIHFVPPSKEHIAFQFHDLRSHERKVYEKYVLTAEPMVALGPDNIVRATVKQGQPDAGTVYGVRRVRPGPESTPDVGLEQVKILYAFKAHAVANVKGPEYIHHMHDYFMNQDGSIDIVLDPFTGCTLQETIAQRDGMSERRANNLGKQLCQGVAYLHKNSIAHGSLNLTTVWATNPEKGAGRLKITALVKDEACAASTNADEQFDCLCVGLIIWKCLTGNKGSVYLTRSGQTRVSEDDFCGMPTAEDIPNVIALKDAVVGTDLEGHALNPSDAATDFLEKMAPRVEKLADTGIENGSKNPPVPGPLSMPKALQMRWMRPDNATRYV
ncbi:Protein kinase domain-containing protein [Mycena kentingensis (nom. inval.)]|nr:Protein kinase domain-containing protein [Mycena kentingensis (nom. inval.)]